MDDGSWKDKIAIIASSYGVYESEVKQAYENVLKSSDVSEDIFKRYYDMASTIEEANIYDGRGTYDWYICDKCGNCKATTYGCKGVTPFMIGCSCGGTMAHKETHKSVSDYVRVEKWIRPSIEQLKYFSPSTIEHILNGGLILESELHLKMLGAQVAAKESVILEPPKPKIGEIIEYEPPKKAKYRDTHCSGVQIAKRRKKNKNKKTHRK